MINEKLAKLCQTAVPVKTTTVWLVYLPNVRELFRYNHGVSFIWFEAHTHNGFFCTAVDRKQLKKLKNFLQSHGRNMLPGLKLAIKKKAKIALGNQDFSQKCPNFGLKCLSSLLATLVHFSKNSQRKVFNT